MKGRLAALGFCLAAACAGPAGPAKIEDKAPTIAATVDWKVKVDAVLPTDIEAQPDGGFLVMDGYKGRALRYGTDRALAGALGDVASWGHPLRLAAAKDGGFWATDPAGRLLHVGQDGLIVATLSTPKTAAPPEGDTRVSPDAQHAIEPIALVDLGDQLVVSDREGEISWLDSKTGASVRTVKEGLDGEKFTLITDLVATEDGHLLATDAIGARVHTISTDGKVINSFGRLGDWVGYMKQPKSVLPLGGGAIAVADSELGVVQVFDAHGSARGAIEVGDDILRLEHPMALERGKDGSLLVLESGTSTVWSLTVDERSLAASLSGPPKRWLRVALVATDANPAQEEGQRCLQCHDGMLNDSRHVWDPDLKAHPVNVKPEHDVPKFFPLDDQGRLACITCHSPHGASTLAEVEQVQQGADHTALIPHDAGDEPFLRVGRRDSSLCVACHTSAAHEDALAALGLGTGGHPTGKALVAALAKRGKDAQIDPNQEQCLTCHAVHGATGDHLTRGETDGRLCVACHEAQATPGQTHPMGLTNGSKSVHPERSGLPLDQQGHVSCRSCHDLVQGRGAALLRMPEDGGALCVSCHDGDAASLGGGHAHVRGMDGNSCLGCHDPHADTTSESLLRMASRGSKADPDGCLGCHGDKGAAAKANVRPGKLGHPVDGEAHHDGQKALVCETCHTPHDPRPANASTACKDCHADQVAAAERGGHGKAQCLDCHPMHGAQPKASVASNINPSAARCLACHGESSANADAPKIASFQHPDMVFLPDGSRWTPLGGLPLYAADGTQQPSGKNGDLVCSSCHLTHGPDAGEPGDNLRRPGWKDACAACHGEDALPLYRYFHRPDRRADVKGSK